VAIKINVQPGQRVLELGGGANRHEATTVNVDVRQAPGVDVVCDFDKDPLPFQDAEWDAVVSIFCLEHVNWRQTKRLLGEMNRVLKPGGHLILVVPNVAAQMAWAAQNKEGWDGKDFFESASECLFGSMDYEANTHKGFFVPESAKALVEGAGFEGVDIKPYGERSTDMAVGARKPGAAKAAGEKRDLLAEAFGLNGAASNPEKARIAGMPAEAKFDKTYFHGGAKVGGYAGEGYRDFPAHEVTFRHIMQRRPDSVLELGCGRGYVTKRLQDAGIAAAGIEVSRHCWLTRACDGVITHDICKTPWPVVQDRVSGEQTPGYPDTRFDLCFSIATLEHIPEQSLPAVLAEMKRTCKRGLHGIDFGQHDDGWDKTHCSLHDQDWWTQLFKEHGLDTHEIVDKESLEQGDFPELKEVLAGDGKVKLNLGSFITMFNYGWQNLDILPNLGGFAQANGYTYRQWDAKAGIPYPTGSVDAIYSSHMLEHLTYAEGQSLLKECRRVIRPDGAMRLIVPDAGLLQRWYDMNAGTQNGTIVSDPQGMGPDYFDEVNDACAATKSIAAKVWSLLHENHFAAYDEATLCEALREAGWVPLASRFRDTLPDTPSFRQMRKETIDMQPALSLFVNAVASMERK
jgi:predicted SAM-dependent methyltransferase